MNGVIRLILIEPDKLLEPSHNDDSLSIVSVKGDDEHAELYGDLRVASMAQVRVQRGSEFFSRVVFIRDLQPADQLHVKDESGIQLNVSVVQVKPLLSLVLPS